MPTTQIDHLKNTFLKLGKASNLVALKAIGSKLEIKNAADSAYVNIQAAAATFTDTVVASLTYTGFPIAARAWNVSRRQCIEAGPCDSNGQPNSLSSGGGFAIQGNYSAADPLVLSFAAGFDQYGAIDYCNQLTTNQNFGGLLTATNTFYLYVDRDTFGTLTSGRSTLRPLYQRTAPSSPATDQHWFNTSQDVASSGQVGMRMYRWSGSAWVQVQRVFVGQATTDGSTVTQLINYSYQRRYLSNWLAATTNTTYNFQHALGMSVAEAEAVPTFYGRINSSDIAVQAGFLTFDAYGLQPLGATAPATLNYSVFTGASALFYSAGAWQTSGDLQLSLVSGW